MWDIGICPIFYSPADDEGEQGENKNEYFSSSIKTGLTVWEFQ